MDTSVLSILANWNLGEVTSTETFSTDKYRCSGNVHFVRCGDSRFVLKRMERKSALGPLFTVLPQLHKQGVPVAAPVPTRDGRFAAYRDGYYYYVVPFLNGSVISDHFGPGMERRSASLGMALARLHTALRQVVLPASLARMNLLSQVHACGVEVRARGMSRLAIAALEALIPHPPLGRR